MSTIAVDVVRRFWELMATNDFRSVGVILAEGFVLDWPQSNERIRGAERFARMNEEYPAHGRWSFTVNRIVGGESEAVSDVSITDGTQNARAISLHGLAWQDHSVGGILARAVRSPVKPQAPRRGHRVSPSRQTAANPSIERPGSSSA